MSSRSHNYLHRSLPAPRLVSDGVLGGIAQITPSLYLSRGNVASNRNLLLSRGITCIVNATIELPNFNWPQFEYVKVPIADMPHAPISLYFDSIADRIHNVTKKHGATLVHCAAGVSRSASLCIAYLMKYHKVSLLEAYNWIKSRRPIIRPNVGFWRQLIDYERKLFGKSSIKMVQTPYGIMPDIYEKERRNLTPYWGI
ncbi:dual specificity protein phosphatase 14 [Latimeria chalumnae]|uniref:Dual specificity phosphatase 14 n=1 Tax=Latimeria chalumnae TaxID=7897 RepID=H3AUR0_LATCH|nr:PREDICTED: dual specificity protein phosphatase 14 [Latimeria chalumnae]|eukprot:XP_005987506.1 PREDICTED: dual specificity protein phosphatase 14 [Latimeria chalumnae]